MLNGQVPYSIVSVVLASGTDVNGYWEFRCTPAFAARWAFAKQEAVRRFGRTIYIRPGWNIYRPLSIQRDARTRACASGNCNGASVAGYSSHGGNWQGRDCLAVDVDPNGLSWDQVDQAMEAAGFSARLITEAMSGIPGGERWHYMDFNAFGAVPAFSGAKPLDPGTNPDTEALIMNQDDKNWLNGLGQSIIDQINAGPIRADLNTVNQAVQAVRADLNYVHQLSPYSLKAILEGVRGGSITLTDAQVKAISGQLAAAAIAGIDAALKDDFDGLKTLIAKQPPEFIAALKDAL